MAFVRVADMLEFKSVEELQKALKQQPNTKSRTQASTERQQLERERLELAKLKFEYQKEKDRQKQEQEQAKIARNTNRSEPVIYLFSTVLTFATILSSVILFIIILIKG